jgi:hypothetical protein
MQTFTIPAVDRASAVKRLAEFLSEALPGKPLRVMVELAKPRRSDAQNSYWWGVVVKTFCDRLDGWEAEDVHAYLCGEHFGWERVEGLGKTRLRPVKRSSKVGRVEFAELVETAQRLGAKHGIYIPDPNEPGPSWPATDTGD